MRCFYDSEYMVGEVGLEPTSREATDFKSVVYTNSTTRPGVGNEYMIHYMGWNKEV